MIDVSKLKLTVQDFIKKNQDHLFSLRERWRDEKDYEPYDDYKSALEKVFQERFRDVKIKKSFAIDCESDGWLIFFKVNLSSIRFSISQKPRTLN